MERDTIRVMPEMPVDLVFETSKLVIAVSVDEFGEVRIKTNQSVAVLPIEKDHFALMSAFDFDRDFNLPAKAKAEPKRRFKTKKDKDKSLPEKDRPARKVDPTWSAAIQHLRGSPADDDPFLDN